MPIVIRMPDFGTAVSGIRITHWLREEGATVKRGELLAEIETDKAATELESIAEGVVLKRLVADGALVESGQPIAWIGSPGEQLPGEVQRPKVATVVANLAAKLGVDLARVIGTGERGTITREDVVRASKESGAKPAASEQVERLSRAQAAVARAVEKSNAEIPHLRVAASIDMTAAEALRAQLPAEARKAFYDALFLGAMAKAMQAVPLMAARLEAGGVVHPGTFHIAVAVASGTDLFLPVVRDVDRKALPELRQEVESAAARARAGTLRIEETTGASVALTNLGMYPIEWFDAIIFPGHTAMLALGAVQDRPTIRGGTLEVRPMATVTLAADHRLINGRVAAEYLTTLKQLIES